MPICGSKFQILGGKKIVEFFDILKMGTFGPGDSQSVTYLKIQTKVCRTS